MRKLALLILVLPFWLSGCHHGKDQRDQGFR